MAGFAETLQRWVRAWSHPAPPVGNEDAAAEPPPAFHAAELQPGDLLGGYRIARPLARGAMGAVYLAIDPLTRAPVALKTLALAHEFEAENLPAARERFLQEAEAACRLRHPDIVTVHGAGEDRGLAFIVMEPLAGTDLTRYTRPARLLPEPVVLRIAARVAQALAYAHDSGVVHRDVKPANVMVDLVSHQVKVTDFGVARMTDASRTRSGLVLGTPSFMSPEQLAGARLDGRSDLYSLGVMLFQLLTGRLPYESASLGQLLQAIGSGQPLALLALRPELPPQLADVVARALDKSPEGRHADGRELAHDLRQIEAAWPPPQHPPT